MFWPSQRRVSERGYHLQTWWPVSLRQTLPLRDDAQAWSKARHLPDTHHPQEIFCPALFSLRCRDVWAQTENLLLLQNRVSANYPHLFSLQFFSCLRHTPRLLPLEQGSNR